MTRDELAVLRERNRTPGQQIYLIDTELGSYGQRDDSTLHALFDLAEAGLDAERMRKALTKIRYGHHSDMRRLADEGLGVLPVPMRPASARGSSEHE